MNCILNKSIHIFLTITLGCLLASCANVRPPHPNIILKVSNWQASGRIAFNDGQEGANANFIWQQTAELFNIEIFGPFGADKIFLYGVPGKITMLSKSGEKLTAASAEELLNKQVGWHIPVSGLQYWIRGFPCPNLSIQSQTYNINGQLQTLSQQGWELNYIDYKNFNGNILPAKIDLKNNNLKVKVIIRSWITK